MVKLKVCIIGLGKQNLEDHIPAVLESDFCTLDTVYDIDINKVKETSIKYSVLGYTDLDLLLKETKPNIGIIAIPHIDYLNVVKKLAKNKVNILKEKPFSISVNESIEIHKILQKHNVIMQVSVQRRFHPIYKTFSQLIKRIGRIYSIEARYVMNIPNLDKGWRAKKSLSGGGALIDMGYHFVDLLIWYFGLPDEVFSRVALGNKDGQVYDVEDTAIINFTYYQKEQKQILGSFLVSRVYPKKEELITVIGTKGSIQLERGVIRRLNNLGDIQEELMRLEKWPSAAVEQLDHFANLINDSELSESPHIKHFEHMALIESAYKSAILHQNTFPKELIKKL